MFYYNKINYLPITKLQKYSLIDNECLWQLKSFSSRISGDDGVTAFFGIIQKLVLTGDTQKLEGMMNVSISQLNYLRTGNHNTGVCQKFIQVINELIQKLKGSYEQTTVVLKELYSRKENISGYLHWVLSGMQNDRLRELSKQFQVRIIQYQIHLNGNEKQLLIVGQINQCQGYGDLLDIRLLQLETGFHLLYVFSYNQMDSISRMFFKDRINLQRLKDQEEKITNIANQYDKNIQVFREKSELKVKKLEDEKLVLSNNNDRLVNEIKRLESEGHANQQTIIKAKKQIMKLKQANYNLEEEKEELERKTRRTNNTQVNFFENNMETEEPSYVMKKNKTQIKQQVLNSKPSRRTIIQMQQQPPITQIPKIPKFPQFNERKPPNNLAPNQFGYKRQKQRTNFFDISCPIQKQVLKDCEVCLEPMIPFSIFKCNHLSCSNCLVQSINNCLSMGSLPVCVTDGCGQEIDQTIALTFLKDRKRMDVKDKLEDTMIKRQFKDKLFECPVCTNLFQINEKEDFIKHCGKTFCRKCGQQHPADKKCEEIRYLAFVDMFSFPTVCPKCYRPWDKDQKCDHVTCINCKETDPQGFCAFCSAIRSPTIAHDNCYHRTDCKYYFANPEPLKRKEKCSECLKLPAGEYCRPPTENMTQFLQAHFSKQFVIKFLKKRQQYAALKKE